MENKGDFTKHRVHEVRTGYAQVLEDAYSELMPNSLQDMECTNGIK